MIVLDLHGMKHKDVSRAVSNMCATEATPFIIITGNSSEMKQIVGKVAKTFNLCVRDTIDNPGRVVVYESR